MMISRASILGSSHVAATLAFGDFILADGQSIHCDAIQGLSGVTTERTINRTKEGYPRVELKRTLTHFYWPDPEILIEQNPNKASTGTLTGNGLGGDEALLPGTASFSQFIILTFNGRPLANREPLVMTAKDVVLWPPIGSDFETEGPTHFYDLADLNDPRAPIIATLDACKTAVVQQFVLPLVPLAVKVE